MNLHDLLSRLCLSRGSVYDSGSVGSVVVTIHKSFVIRMVCQKVNMFRGDTLRFRHQ